MEEGAARIWKVSRWTCKVAAALVKVEGARRRVGGARVQVGSTFRQIRSSFETVGSNPCAVLEEFATPHAQPGRDSSAGQRAGDAECHQFITGNHDTSAPCRVDQPDRVVSAKAQVVDLMENDSVRVFRATIKAGTTTSMHTHALPRATYVESGGTLRIRHPDGRVDTLVLTTGSTSRLAARSRRVQCTTEGIERL